MAAYYNEIDPFAAAWLRELIKAGVIAPGDIDERSIEDVRPNDLRPYTQCHFFAGIGVWSYALRNAGWDDERPVWTGSCPCQPFSSAGKGAGFADERHLWPAFFHLIRECRPDVVFGEQVASKDGLAWLDTVYADLETACYAAGAVDLCAAGVGAPHIRQRLWFIAENLLGDSAHGRRIRGELGNEESPQRTPSVGGQDEGRWRYDASYDGACDRLANTADDRQQRSWQETSVEEGRQPRPDGTGQLPVGLEGRALPDALSPAGLEVIGLADPHHQGLQGRFGAGERGTQCSAGQGGVVSGLADAESIRSGERQPHAGGRLARSGERQGAEPVGDGGALRPSPTNGFWSDADWLYCRDGKWRPVEPGTFPLAHSAPARVGRLRGYGNAINAEAATQVIEAYREHLGL